MPVSYAGVPLVTITHEAATWAEAMLHIAEWDVFQVRHDRSETQARLSIPNVENRYQPRLGCLIWPRYARKWATGLFLATSDQLTLIRNQVYSGGSYSIQPLILDDGTGLTNRSITTNLWMLPAHPVVAIPGYTGLYVIILVDDRYFTNLRSGALSVTSGTTTHSQLITSALTAGAIQSGAVVSSINTAYLKPGPAETCTVHEYAGMLIDSVAYNCGLRVTRTLDQITHVQNPADALASVTANLALGFSPMLGDSMSLSGAGSDSPGITPYQVAVDFPNLDTGALITKTYTTGASTNPANIKYFKSTGVTTHDAIWTPSAALQTFTNQFGADWYNWQLGVVNETWAGVCAWVPDALTDQIEWIFREDMICTRVLRGPIDDLTEDLLHAVPNPLPSGPVVIPNPVTVTGSLTVAGPYNTTFTATSNVSGTENNYPAPTTFGVGVNPTAATTFTGFTAPSPSTPQNFTITNTSSTYPFYITNLDSGSTAGNQVSTTGGVPFTVEPGGSVNLVYNTTGGYWQTVTTSNYFPPTTSSTQSITGTENNYPLPTTFSIVPVNPGSNPTTITGFVAPSPATNQTVTIVNTSTTNTVNITNQDSGSTAGNRVTTSTGATWPIPPGGSVEMIYTASGGWQIVNQVPATIANPTTFSAGFVDTGTYAQTPIAATITGTQTNWTPPSTAFVQLTGTSTPVITGIVPSNPTAGQILNLVNTSSTTIPITNSSGASGNQVLSPTGANIPIPQNNNLILQYVPNLFSGAGGWLPIGGSALPTVANPTVGGAVASSTPYDILAVDASGHLSQISPSTAGYVLTSNGTGAAATFQAAGGGSSPTSTNGSDTDATGYSATNSWAQCNSVQVTLPNIGTYLVIGEAHGEIEDSSFVDDQIEIRLYNSTHSTVVGEPKIIAANQSAPGAGEGSGSMAAIVSTSGTNEIIQLQAQFSNGMATPIVAGTSSHSIVYVQLA